MGGRSPHPPPDSTPSSAHPTPVTTSNQSPPITPTMLGNSTVCRHGQSRLPGLSKPVAGVLEGLPRRGGARAGEVPVVRRLCRQAVCRLFELTRNDGNDATTSEAKTRGQLQSICRLDCAGNFVSSCSRQYRADADTFRRHFLTAIPQATTQKANHPYDDWLFYVT